MKTAHIICSIKNLNRDYDHLQWLRLYFLSNGYHLSEDWINHSLVMHGSKPYFRAAPNFDYMRVATQAINDADLVVFLMSEQSNFTLTMLRYAMHVRKNSIVICGNHSALQGISELTFPEMTILNLKTYQKNLKDIL